jgi:hypothetical protein
VGNFDWKAWAENHEFSVAAGIVLAWLEKHDPEEPVWWMREELVELVRLKVE